MYFNLGSILCFFLILKICWNRKIFNISVPFYSPYWFSHYEFSNFRYGFKISDAENQIDLTLHFAKIERPLAFPSAILIQSFLIFKFLVWIQNQRSRKSCITTFRWNRKLSVFRKISSRHRIRNQWPRNVFNVTFHQKRRTTLIASTKKDFRACNTTTLR